MVHEGDYKYFFDYSKDKVVLFACDDGDLALDIMNSLHGESEDGYASANVDEVVEKVKQNNLSYKLVGASDFYDKLFKDLDDGVLTDSIVFFTSCQYKIFKYGCLFLVYLGLAFLGYLLRGKLF